MWDDGGERDGVAVESAVVWVIPAFVKVTSLTMLSYSDFIWKFNNCSVQIDSTLEQPFS